MSPKLSAWRHLAMGVLVGAAACLGEGVDAVSKPSQDVTLSFTRPGRIAGVLVKEGQELKASDSLVQLDDAAEQVDAERLRAQAEDVIRVKAAEAQLAQKKADLEKVEGAAKGGASTVQEVEHARLDVVIAELSVQLAKFEHEQDQRKYDEAKIQVQRMRLTSPIPGKVEKLMFKVGESVDALKDVIRVVNIDLLWIDTPVPRRQAQGLKLGQAAEVEFAQDGPDTASGGARAKGKIIHIAAVGDAASETLMVRVELPNPARRPAGEHVKVYFPRAEDRAGGPGDSRAAFASTQPVKE